MVGVHDALKDHPLEQIAAWVSVGKDSGRGIVEFFGEGPKQLDMTELEFREWTNEGIAEGILSLGGLTDIIRSNSTPRGLPLPDEPQQHESY